MKIGVNMWAWGSHYTTDELPPLFEKAASLGADFIEIGIEDDRELDTKVLRRVTEDLGIGSAIVCCFGPELDMSSEDAGIRADGMAFARHCVEVAAGLGAEVMNGAVAGVDGRVAVIGEARRSRLEHLAEGMRVVADLATEAGVRFGFEVLNRYEANLINTARQARELVDLTDHPNAGILLDCFHMGMEEPDPGAAIRIAGEKLFHLQASDNYRGSPGSGIFPWQDVATALRDIGYPWDVAIECFNMASRMGPQARLWHTPAEQPDDVARKGLAFLKETLRG